MKKQNKNTWTEEIWTKIKISRLNNLQKRIDLGEKLPPKELTRYNNLIKEFGK